MKKTTLILVAVPVLGLLLWSALFTVDETQVVIVARFGAPRATITEPGLYVKFPDPVETLTVFDKRLLTLNAHFSELLTRDKKNIVADAYLCWRIKDSQRFLQTVGNLPQADLRLNDLIFSELGAVLGQHDLSHLVSVEKGQVKISQINATILKNCQERAEKAYGIEIVDARLRSFNFPPENRGSVFDRMRSERQRIAARYRAEGEQKAMEIRARANKEARAALSEAYREAQVTMGEGDAGAMRIYAEAHQKDPEFYRLVRTLAAYEKFLNSKTTMILSSESELLELLGKVRERK